MDNMDGDQIVSNPLEERFMVATSAGVCSCFLTVLIAYGFPFACCL